LKYKPAYMWLYFFYQFLFQYFGTNCFLSISQYLIFINLQIMVVETLACRFDIIFNIISMSFSTSCI
ncbi:hypothetical protein T11_18244, partial [Trichinella zimbabwensis]